VKKRGISTGKGAGMTCRWKGGVGMRRVPAACGAGASSERAKAIDAVAAMCPQIGELQAAAMPVAWAQDGRWPSCRRGGRMPGRPARIEAVGGWGAAFGAR